MENALPQWIFFWAALIVISGWLLKKFYFTASSEKISRLRYAAIFVDAVVLALFFLAWIPASLSGAQETGLSLMLQGNIDVVVVFALVASSLIFLVANKAALLKTGAVSNIAASVIFIGALLRLFPETYTMRFSESAPIFIAIMLLAGNVVALFLWHQLQLGEGKKINVWGGKRIALGLIIFILVVFGYWFWSSHLGKTAVRFESERFGYSVALPRYWQIETSQADQPAEVFKNPSEEVLIFIQHLPAPGIGAETVREILREEFEKDTWHTLEIFDERVWHGRRTVYAEGIYSGGVKYRFLDSLVLPK